MSRSSDVNVPTGWWAAELHWNRGLFEVFNRRPASLEGAVCLRKIGREIGRAHV